jgi:hypothetical protein
MFPSEGRSDEFLGLNFLTLSSILVSFFGYLVAYFIGWLVLLPTEV